MPAGKGHHSFSFDDGVDYGVNHGLLYSRVGKAMNFNLCGPSPSGNSMKKPRDTNPLKDAWEARIHTPRVKNP